MNQNEFIKSRLHSYSTGGTNLYVPMCDISDFTKGLPSDIIIPIDFEGDESHRHKYFYLRDGSKLNQEDVPEFLTFQSMDHPNGEGHYFLTECDKDDWGVDLIYVVRLVNIGYKAAQNTKKLIKLLTDKNIVFFTKFSDMREFGKSIKR